MIKFISRTLSILIIPCIILTMNGCGSMEDIPGDTGRVNGQEIPGSTESPLLERAGALAVSSPDKNHVHILNIGEDALIARIHLIRSARKSINIQTIIWVNDEVGRFMMYELIQAAKRGVKVKVLVDHIASERHLELATFVASIHPNLQIKIYNPLSIDRKSAKMDPSFTEKLLSLLFSFNRFNQRMHNKTFIVDDLVAITGGRNYQNAYFDQARGLNYKDRDIIVVGPVVSEISDSFQAYWDFEYSVDLNNLKDVKKIKKRGDVKIWDTRESFQLHGLFGDIDAVSNDKDIIGEKFTKVLTQVDDAYFIADDPGKNPNASNGPSAGKSKITLELARLVSTAKESIYLQTPYLILTSPAIDLFDEIRKKNPEIDIRISTNSLAATDSWYVYALSFKQKQTYLNQLKFIIYEIKPLPGDMYSLMPTYDKLRTRPLTPSEKEKIILNDPGAEDRPAREKNGDNDGPALLERPPRPGEPYFCLHAKSMVVDDELLFIGSYNLDPRSENINTEAGIVIRDRKLAKLLKENILRDMASRNSWVIAKKQMPLGLHHPNALFVTLSDRFPFLDPWPFRNTASFELIEGKTPVEVTHKDFYNNYRDVGSFPQTDEDSGDKVLGAVGTKTFLSFVKPLL